MVSPANHCAYGVFLAICRFKSGASSDHQTGPRSPSSFFIKSIRCRAFSRRTLSPTRIAAPFSRRARISSLTNFSFSSEGKDGFVHRQRRPLTTKYRPSGVVGLAAFTAFQPVGLEAGSLPGDLHAGDRHFSAVSMGLSRNYRAIIRSLFGIVYRHSFSHDHGDIRFCGPAIEVHWTF